MPTSERDHQAILEHVTWVQRLAYRLCADAAQAEDVSQESLLSAFREPRRRGASLRQWLVGVVRNQARMAHRSARRRLGHEAAVAPPEAPSSPEQLVERAATQRLVVTAVTELPEIYRTALLRRYFDDMGPAEIAAHEGVPEATIKTRLRRGLQALRDRLADDFDGVGGEDGGAPATRRSGAWCAALLPLAEAERRRRLATGGTAAVGGAGPIWLLAAGCVAAALWVGYGWLRAPVGPVVDVGAPTSTNEAAVGLQEVAATVGEARTRIAGGRADEQGSLHVRAFVCSVDGIPVHDVDLVVTGFSPGDEQGRVVARTDVHGRGSFDTAAELRQLVARSERIGPLRGQTRAGPRRRPAAASFGSGQWLTVVPATIFPHARVTDVRVVVARRRAVTGIVTDVHGAPIAGARVHYHSTVDLGARLGSALDRASRRLWSTTSDAAGAFELACVPELPGAVVRADAWDHEQVDVPVATRGDVVATCALPRRATRTTWLQGHVRRPDGDLVGGAVVTLGSEAVRTAADGSFRLDAARANGATSLAVAMAGFAPLRVERPDRGWQRHVELRLGEPCRSVRGRVVDDSGNACAGVEVDLGDSLGHAFLRDGERADHRAVPLEQLALGRRTRVVTDAHGRFELGGLADRAYRLVVRAPARLAIAGAGPFPAGAVAVVVTLPMPAATVRVAGRVVDDRGEPLRSVVVRASRSLDQDESVSMQCTTDDDGRFAFASALPRDVRLHASAGGDFTAIDAALTDFVDPSRLQLVVRAAGSFYVQQTILDAQPFDGFRVESAVGEGIWLQRVDGRNCFTIGSGTLVSGRSPVYRVPAGEHVLALLRAGRVVRRIALAIRAGPTIRVDI